MATKKANIYGANNAPKNALANSSTIAAPTFTPDNVNGYPITFGFGEAAAGTLTTIATKNDGKIRFVYDVKDGITSTNSGAIYVGGSLASSKILDIITDAVAPSAENPTGIPASHVTVKFINATNAVETLTFGVVDPSIVEALETRVKKLESWAEGSVVTEAENGAITVKPTANADDFNTYTVGVKVDGTSVKVVNDKLAVATYAIDKLNEGETGFSKEYASQYRLMMNVPGSDEPVLVGDTINIMKDFLLKSAHVCAFTKNADGSDYTVDPTSTPVDGKDVYAVVTEAIYADETVTVEGETVYLEKAPKGKDLKIGHTYLHLILNTKPTDEGNTDTTTGINDTTSDVYLDFTEILGAASFQEMQDKIEEHDVRLDNIEAGYVKSVTETAKAVGSQFNTVTITTASKDVSTATETTTSAATFDIPNQSYYETVDRNFTTLQANDAYLAGLLAWTGLD